jgi:hypothetical protein
MPHLLFVEAASCRFASWLPNVSGSFKAAQRRGKPPLVAIKSPGMSDSENPNYDPSTYIGYFDPTQPIAELLGNLPHWRQEGVTYFVTFRLADSIPEATLQLWLRERDDWLERHPEPQDKLSRQEYYRLFVERFHKWLDGGHGSCVLAQPPVREIVTGALMHFDMVRYVVREWVVIGA